MSNKDLSALLDKYNDQFPSLPKKQSIMIHQLILEAYQCGYVCASKNAMQRINEAIARLDVKEQP